MMSRMKRKSVMSGKRRVWNSFIRQFRGLKPESEELNPAVRLCQCRHEQTQHEKQEREEK
jgi:hypothetical protein